MEFEWSACVLKNLMESGRADLQSLGDCSHRHLVMSNLISEINNAVFSQKTQNERAQVARVRGGFPVSGAFVDETFVGLSAIADELFATSSGKIADEFMFYLKGRAKFFDPGIILGVQKKSVGVRLVILTSLRAVLLRRASRLQRTDGPTSCLIFNMKMLRTTTP
jgi:hypothetical protein